MSVGDMRSAGNVETQESFTCNKNRPFPRNGGIPAKIRNSPSTLHKDTAEVKLTLVRALCTPGSGTRCPFVRHLPFHRTRPRQPRCRRVPLRAHSLRPRLHTDTRRCLGLALPADPTAAVLGRHRPTCAALRPRDPATQPTSRLPCSAELASHHASTHMPAPLPSRLP